MRFSLATVTAVLLLSFVPAQSQENANGEVDIAQPILLRRAFVSSTTFGPKKQWVNGVEVAYQFTPQKYVVMVPGSEGYPSRFEQRERKVRMVVPVPHRYLTSEVEFADLNGNSLAFDEAAGRIEKCKAFLFLPKGAKLLESDRSVYAEELVVVSIKEQ